MSTSPFESIARDLLHHRSGASHPRLSPTGDHVACVVATTDLDDNKVRTRVWLDGQPLTAGPSDGNPTWSPDGRYLAFTSKRGDKKSESTLHVIGIEAPGETRLVATMPDGLGEPAWSPDGRWIAFTSRTQHERYRADDVSWQSPRRIDRFATRLNGEDFTFDRPRHIYVVRADGTDSPTNLSEGEFQYSSPSWLADSSGVVVSGGGSDGFDENLADDLYVFDLDGNRRELTGSTGIFTLPSVSPTGDQIAFIGYDNPLEYPQNAKVGVMPVGGGEHRWVSTGLDRTFFNTSGTRSPVWLDDSTLLALAEDRGETHLYRLTVDDTTPEPVTDGAITVHDFDAAGDAIATVRSQVEHGPELWVERNDGAEQVTDIARSYLSWERFAVPTTDGTDEIDAWVMRPPDFDPTMSYPVLLNVHGGPFTQYGEYFFDEAQMQAAAGFVVLMSNPRGGSGRHTGWGQSIMGPKHPTAPGTGWGTVDVDDVMAVLDHALEHFDGLDTERVGMLGGSYGGYMATMLAARFSDRFRGVCSERSVNNLLTEEWSADIANFFRIEHGPNAVEDPDEYLRMSPITLARDITVPMLIIHSEDDFRCPINQAEELWVTLKLLHRDVTFYRFPGENHELSRSGSPVHRRQRAEIILEWFADQLNLRSPSDDR